MYGQDKPLDNPINWSFKIGRLFGIDIRVHIAFLIGAVVLVWMQRPDPDSLVPTSFWKNLSDGLGTYAILFAIVLLHEFGHCYGARRTGGTADEILLWPLGGLASVAPTHNARAHMITTVAGPAVNVVICGLCSALIVLWFGSLWAVPWNPLHPTRPVDTALLPTVGQWWLLRVYGISYFILLINLLPIFPFDGGRILQAWLWPRKGYQASMQIATSTGMIGAIVIGLVGLFIEQSWLLLMIAVFGYMTCWQTRRMAGEFGDYESSLSPEGSYAFETKAEARPGYFARRSAKRAVQRAAKAQEAAKHREEEVERILRKVSEHGIASLLPKERRMLEAETQRQRSSGA